MSENLITIKYDSKLETLSHINLVRSFINLAIDNLSKRGEKHDLSKLEEPEKSGFDSCTFKLKSMEFGSDEYKKALEELKPFLSHHYSKNSHHPEHYKNGIDGMSLFDILEMLLDWKAATERMKDKGDIRKSLEINSKRFNMSEQLVNIFNNTINEMGW